MLAGKAWNRGYVTRIIRATGRRRGRLLVLRLRTVLLNKLPQEFQLILSRGVSEDEWKLDRLMALLEEEVQARERATTNSQVTPRKPIKGTPTAATLLRGGSETQTAICYYCQQSNLASSCEVVKTPEEKYAFFEKQAGASTA